MNKEKTYIIEGLGCANCAAKMESKIQQLPGIDSAAITFATKQLKVTAPDPDSLRTRMEDICQSIESQVHLVEKTSAKAPASGALQGERQGELQQGERQDGLQQGERQDGLQQDERQDGLRKQPLSRRQMGLVKRYWTDLWPILAGAVLFAAGVILSSTGFTDSLLLPLFLLSYLILGGRVLITAARNILHGQVFDENFLMSIATISAFCIGEFAEGAGVMLFYRIGEFFEHVAVERSRTQIMDAVDMRPETVALVGETEETRIISAEAAKPGDILLVRPGDRIPLDGMVLDGESRIDTSPITGEPVPVSARPGTEVISGCVNVQGVLKIRVTHPLAESMVSRILDSVENAAAGKPKIDKFITRFARVYTPIVVALAVLTAILPSMITGQWSFWITTAITFLVISCPCALVISVPLAFFSGIGAASKLGILFKGGLAIEALKHVKAIVMDKTGTITKGVFAVDRIVPFGHASEEDVLSVAAGCEAASSHPVAVSIMEKAAEMDPQSGLCSHGPASIEELAGMGIVAELCCGDHCGADAADRRLVDGGQTAGSHFTALCGNRKLMKRFNVEIPALPPDSGTEVLIALNGVLMGQIIISDQLKNDSVSAVDRIKSMGLVPAMLTGDNVESAAAVAASGGIEKVRAGLLPEDKVTALKELRDELGAVMFVGDGINDAPVLAGADVGAAMGSGADAAIEAADVVFMTSSLKAVPQSVTIARYTNRIAMQNIVFALAVKLLVILLGLAGFANIWAAVFADTGVAMLCILNSLRVLWRKY